MRGGEFAQRGKVAAVGFGVDHRRWHGHQAGHPDRTARDESREFGWRDTSLGLLSGDVDFDEDIRFRRGVTAQLFERRIRGDGMDQLDLGQQLADLAALQLPDEVPGEHAGVGVCLGFQVLSAVFPQQSDSCPSKRAEVRHGQVLDGREQLDVVGVPAGPVCGGGDLLTDPGGLFGDALRLNAFDQASNASAPWRPVRPASRRWEKKRAG